MNVMTDNTKAAKNKWFFSNQNLQSDQPDLSTQLLTVWTQSKNKPGFCHWIQTSMLAIGHQSIHLLENHQNNTNQRKTGTRTSPWTMTPETMHHTYEYVLRKYHKAPSQQPKKMAHHQRVSTAGARVKLLCNFSHSLPLVKTMLLFTRQRADTSGTTCQSQ